jgi:Family of unknown function (DUF5336)
MTDRPDDSVVTGYGVPVHAHAWYRSSANESNNHRLRRSLWTVVAILGAAVLVVSLGSPVALGFPVQLSVSAAIVAAVGLLRRQAERGWIVVALAATAFVDAVATWITSGQPHWTLTVVMVLNALQSAAALGALLHETTVPRSADSDHRQDYAEYAHAVAAYQAYAMQYQQASTAQYGAAGQATAHADADATGRHAADAHVDAAHDSNAALQARYAQYRMPDPTQHSRGRSDTQPVGVDPGMPAANHDAPQSYPYHSQWEVTASADTADGTAPSQ